MNWKYLFPGVGLIYHIKRERKERKDKKPMYNIRNSKDIRALGNYVLQTSYLIFALSKAVSTGYVVYQGVSKGDWNPLHLILKEKTEKADKLEKKSNLEKTIHYENILK